jgi:hypothetical protein
VVSVRLSHPAPPWTHERAARQRCASRPPSDRPLAIVDCHCWCAHAATHALPTALTADILSAGGDGRGHVCHGVELPQARAVGRGAAQRVLAHIWARDEPAIMRGERVESDGHGCRAACGSRQRHNRVLLRDRWLETLLSAHLNTACGLSATRRSIRRGATIPVGRSKADSACMLSGERGLQIASSRSAHPGSNQP